jgi:hypothetical protein
MSITLEGKATVGEEGGSWSGLWRFTKEKKSFLAYTFKVKCVRVNYRSDVES